MTPSHSVPLTRKLNVPHGSHILYFYTNPDEYINNVVCYIKSGLALGQHVLVIESVDYGARILEQLAMYYPEHLISAYVHMRDQDEFYEPDNPFEGERVLRNLGEAIQPYTDNQIEMRLWGRIKWLPEERIRGKLFRYEYECDSVLHKLRYLTVCAYDGNTVPAAIQTEMMRTHEYFMTDDAVVLSSLYHGTPSEDPSLLALTTLTTQNELESEMDLYRRKLDFVHVISHEVRNPLTVIKAYSKLLMDKTDDPSDRDKLKAICDYVMLIDNELSHIISTEQMLSSESLWRKRLTAPKALLEEVMEMMDVKARTQNIRFDHRLDLTGKEMLFSNAIGFKLIVSNVISNAIKYSEEGTAVSFAASSEGGVLILVTEDQGVGMTEDQLERLFQKYEKTNEQKGGHGIGLFMVKQLVDHHEGQIIVESHPGSGTKVTISLPLQPVLTAF